MEPDPYPRQRLIPGVDYIGLRTAGTGERRLYCCEKRIGENYYGKPFVLNWGPEATDDQIYVLHCLILGTLGGIAYDGRDGDAFDNEILRRLNSNWFTLTREFVYDFIKTASTEREIAEELFQQL